MTFPFYVVLLKGLYNRSAEFSLRENRQALVLIDHLNADTAGENEREWKKFHLYTSLAVRIFMC